MTIILYFIGGIGFVTGAFLHSGLAEAFTVLGLWAIVGAIMNGIKNTSL